MATVQDVINQVLGLLGQPADSEIAALPSGGAAGDYAVSASDGLVGLINQGQNDLARQVLPIHDSALVVVALGNILPPYNQITTLGGRVPHSPVGISVGGYLLTQSRFGDLAAWYSAPNPATGAPQAWADLTFSAQLSSPVTRNTTFALDAFCLPVQVVSTTDTLDVYVDEEMQRLVGYWCAVNIVWRNTDYPDLQPRAQVWWQQFVQGRQMKWQAVIANDPTLAAYFPPLPDVANALPNVAPKVEARV